MADDRALELPEEAIGRIDGKLADLESTILARLSRRPVGDVELAFRPAPKPGTIFLQGQTLNRADFPDLWAWAQEVGAVVAGGYTAGNGSTTFSVPDARGKALRVVAATGEAIGALVGADSRTLTTAQMPAHGHTTSSDSHAHGGSVGSAGGHNHDTTNGRLDNNGGHGGHFPGTSFNAAAGADLGLAAWNSGGGTRGDHGHFFSLDITSVGGHTHPISTDDDAHSHTVDPTGGGGAIDMRQASIGINLAVWT